MADFVKIAKKGDVASGSMKTFVVDGKHIALANVDDQYFAINDECTHEHCSLGSEGFLDGNILTCGCHGGQFDVTSGKVLVLPPPVDVASYEVEVKGDDIFVHL